MCERNRPPNILLFKRPPRRKEPLRPDPNWLLIAKRVAPLILIAAAGALVLWQKDQATGPDDEGLVWVTAIDGDTYRLGERWLRLKGVDTPEPTKYGNAECPEEAALGDKASRYARELVAKTQVRIEWSGEKDVYGRDLVMLYVGEDSISDLLIREGLAEPWRGHQADWCEILR